VLTVTSGLSQLRPYYTDETHDVFAMLLNSTSAAEANLALEVLSTLVPSKPLVTACNLREVIRSLPVSPFTMRVDERTLVRTARLTTDMASLRKRLPDDVEVVVTTAGNLVLDLIVKNDGEKYFWTPIPVTQNFVNPAIIDLLITSGYLLDEVIELVKCMGMVFNPKFYLSLEDFHLEYAADAMDEFSDFF
jgi:hypothetical protein